MSLAIYCGFGVDEIHLLNTKIILCFAQAYLHRLEGKAAVMQVIYMDTEGFEASGKSDAYDDRIFALSTFMSALLIYNLPETVRESDIEKLSFAVELAEAFYADVKVQCTADCCLFIGIIASLLA